MTENNDSPITITDDYYNYLYWKELFEGAKEDLDSTRKELEELRGKVMEWNLYCCKFAVTGTEEDHENMVNTANLLVAAVEKQANALSVY